MLDKWNLTSKLSNIKLSHIPNARYIFFPCTRIHLPDKPIKTVLDIFKSFSVFIMIEFGVLDDMSTLPI